MLRTSSIYPCLVHPYPKSLLRASIKITYSVTEYRKWMFPKRLLKDSCAHLLLTTSAKPPSEHSTTCQIHSRGWIQVQEIHPSYGWIYHRGWNVLIFGTDRFCSSHPPRGWSIFSENWWVKRRGWFRQGDSAPGWFQQECFFPIKLLVHRRIKRRNVIKLHCFKCCYEITLKKSPIRWLYCFLFPRAHLQQFLKRVCVCVCVGMFMCKRVCHTIGKLAEICVARGKLAEISQSGFLATYWVSRAIEHSILRPEDPILTESQPSLGVPGACRATPSLLLLVLADEFSETPLSGKLVSAQLLPPTP